MNVVNLLWWEKKRLVPLFFVNTQEWREKEKKERERRRIADFIH